MDYLLRNYENQFNFANILLRFHLLMTLRVKYTKSVFQTLVSPSDSDDDIQIVFDKKNPISAPGPVGPRRVRNLHSTFNNL